MIGRRAPGQRRRRSRREEELAAVEAVDPALHAELVALRRDNPQAYRKALSRLVRKGTIPRGRGYDTNPELLALLEADDERQVRAAVTDAVTQGTADFRTLGAWLEAERQGRARKALCDWLQAQQDAWFERSDRAR